MFCWKLEGDGRWESVYELTRRKFTRNYVLIWQFEWDINRSVMDMYQTCGESRGRAARQPHDLIPVLVVSNFITDVDAL
jgi:hypothetical protein